LHQFSRILPVDSNGRGWCLRLVPMASDRQRKPEQAEQRHETPAETRSDPSVCAGRCRPGREPFGRTL
jgi:hypothetical protein